MDEPIKTIPDPAFIATIVAERDRLQDNDALNAAERAGVRELLGFLPDLREMVAEEQFQKKAAEKIGKWRDNGKAWLLAIAALLGVITAAIAVYKS